MHFEPSTIYDTGPKDLLLQFQNECNFFFNYLGGI